MWQIKYTIWGQDYAETRATFGDAKWVADVVRGNGGHVVSIERICGGDAD